MASGGHAETFVVPVFQDYVCVICTLPLRDSIQTDECGHRFCSSCFDEYQQKQKQRSYQNNSRGRKRRRYV